MSTRISSLQKLDCARRIGHLACTALLVLFAAAPVTSHAFHFPWDQGHDTTDWDDPNDPGPCEGPQCDPCNSTGSPVYLPTGHFIHTEKDVSMPGRPGLALTRTYNSHDPRDGMFGRGWSTNCDDAMMQFVGSEFAEDGSASAVSGYVLRASNGKRYRYLSTASGIRPPPGRFETVQVQSSGNVLLRSSDGSSRTYSRAGRLVSAQSPAGATLSYSYSTFGRLERITDPAGRYIAFEYNSRGRVAIVTDSAGRVWQYGYDASGNLTSVTSPNGGVRRYEYRDYVPPGDAHSYSQLTRITDEAGIVLTNIVYNGERVASYTIGQNRISYSYNTSTRTVTETDLLGSQWAYTYDEAGRVVSARNPLGGVRTKQYNSNGRVLRITDELLQQWSFAYDAADRLIESVNPLGERRTWEYEGDSEYPVRTTSPSGRVTTVAYDANGNVTSLTDPAGATTTFTWNAAGNLQQVRNAAGGTFSLDTNAAGLPTTITDAGGRNVSFNYHPSGRVSSVAAASPLMQTEQDSMGWASASVEPSGARTVYERDAAGRPLRVVDPAGRSIAYEYDSFGRISARVMNDGSRYQYAYRSDNLLSQRTRPGAVVETYSYDAAKRLIGKSVGGESISYTYTARHQLESATNSSGTVTLAYDAVGRVLSESFAGQTTTYAYNEEGEPISISAASSTVQFTRNALGRITAIDAPEGQYSFTYDALARRTGLTYPNGTAVQYVYNGLDQMAEIRSTGPFADVLAYSYGADSLITQRSSSSATWTYGYDADGQLTTASNGAQSFTYQYDASGNRVGAGRTYDAANRLLSDDAHTYTYDANGNLLEKRSVATGARTRYEWNGAGQLRTVGRYVDAAATEPSERIAFSYDALGRRVSRTVNGLTERYVYGGQDRLATIDGSGQVLERVTHGPQVDEPLALDGPGGARFLHADRLGTIIGVSDGTSTVQRYEYGPFGESLGAADAADNAYRFTAREYEADDLYYYRARYYDPTAGRFISEDPLGIASGDTNFYRYAANNPVHVTDPTGEAIWFVIPIIWGAVEVGLAIYDLYDTGSTLLDPCKSAGEKWLAGGLFVAGALLPGGGYSAADDVVVIGRQWDTAVAKDWPGHEVLDIADWTIAKNDAWVRDAIDRGAPVYIASPTTPANMWDSAAGRETVFGREYQQFLDAGYTHQGDYLVPPP